MRQINMGKYFQWLLSLMFMLTLISCGGQSNYSQQGGKANGQQQDNQPLRTADQADDSSRIQGDGNRAENPYSAGGGTGSQAGNQGGVPNTANKHNNTQLVMNPDIAERLKQVEGVRAAKVAVTESNVYIAVDPEPGAEVLGAGDHTGQQVPITDIPNKRSIAPGGVTSGITGNAYDYYYGETGLTGTVSDNGDSPNSLKARIVEQMKQWGPPELHHVYVSFHPDFMQKLVLFETQMKQTGSQSPPLDQFNRLVERVFPVASSTGSYGGSTSSGRSRERNNGSGDDTSLHSGH